MAGIAYICPKCGRVIGFREGDPRLCIYCLEDLRSLDIEYDVFKTLNSDQQHELARKVLMKPQKPVYRAPVRRVEQIKAVREALKPTEVKLVKKAPEEKTVIKPEPAVEEQHSTDNSLLNELESQPSNPEPAPKMTVRDEMLNTVNRNSGNGIITATLSKLTGYKITAYKGTVFGAGVVRTDEEDAFNAAYREAEYVLKKEAAAKQANAVIDVQLSFLNDVTPKRVILSGTSVTVVKN